MFKRFDDKDHLIAESEEAYAIDPGAWCFCIWCNWDRQHPCRGYRWVLTATTRICDLCGHEEGL